MRKTLSAAPGTSASTDSWINLDRVARVEVSSESPNFPVEAALLDGVGPYWRAGGPGPQSIRIRFDEPQQVSRILIRFDVTDYPHTHEFALRWSGDNGGHFQPIVRQQFNFSPPSTSRQEELYRVELTGVTDIDLRIVPDVNGGGAWATLSQFRLG